MRKALFGILMAATMATPLAAQDVEDERHEVAARARDEQDVAVLEVARVALAVQVLAVVAVGLERRRDDHPRPLVAPDLEDPSGAQLAQDRPQHLGVDGLVGAVPHREAVDRRELADARVQRLQPPALVGAVEPHAVQRPGTDRGRGGRSELGLAAKPHGATLTHCAAVSSAIAVCVATHGRPIRLRWLLNAPPAPIAMAEAPLVRKY